MATTLYFRQTGHEMGFTSIPSTRYQNTMSPSRGATATSADTNTVLGPTTGVLGSYQYWLTDTLTADQTISGNITVNLRAKESNGQANTGADILIERCDSMGVVIEQMARSERGTEFTTSETAQNWTVAPTSRNLKKGDRIRISMWGNDVGTMGSGRTFTYYWDGPTAAASGDAYLTFTETFTLQGPVEHTPTTTFSLRSTASDLTITGETEHTLSKTAGTSAYTSDATATVTGPTTGVAFLKTSLNLAFYTSQLYAATITAGSLIHCKFWGLSSNSSAGSVISVKIDRCDSSGSVLAAIVAPTWFNSRLIGGVTQSNEFLLQVASEVVLADSNRIRIQVFADDDPNVVNMQSGYTTTLQYDGTLAQSADSFVGFDVAITDGYTGGGAPPEDCMPNLGGGYYPS